VEIRPEDWKKTMSSESFGLLFMDATPRANLKRENWNSMIRHVKIGGQIVMDDLTPLELWPPEWDDLVDYKRGFALVNPRAIGVEVRTTAGTSALTMTRIK
jgi:predicted O-methyltransferase YrrM